MAMSLKKVLYTGKAHTTGGRNGASRSSDGRLDIKLSSPGTPGNGTNPEQLFAAGWSACFMGAMGLAAAKMRTRLPADAAVDAEVDLCTAIYGAGVLAAAADGFFGQREPTTMTNVNEDR